MRKALRTRLTFSNTISLIAVFAALGGTSYASHLITTRDIASSAVTSSKIKSRNVTNSDLGTSAVTTSKIRNGTVRAEDVAVNGLTAAQITDGTLTLADIRGGEVSRRLFAVVRANGELARGGGVTGSRADGPDGRYDVTFDQDVSNCSYVASLGLPNNDADVNTSPPSGEIGTARLAANPNVVRVRTRNSDGSVDRKPFHLIVVC